MSIGYLQPLVSILYRFWYSHVWFHFLYAKFNSERSKRRQILSLVFILKCVSKKLLIKKFLILQIFLSVILNIFLIYFFITDQKLRRLIIKLVFSVYRLVSWLCIYSHQWNDRDETSISATRYFNIFTREIWLLRSFRSRNIFMGKIVLKTKSNS